MNKDWKDEYGGNLELYDVYPKFNTAIIFRTSVISYHGLPTPIKCPK